MVAICDSHALNVTMRWIFPFRGGRVIIPCQRLPCTRPPSQRGVYKKQWLHLFAKEGKIVDLVRVRNTYCCWRIGERSGMHHHWVNVNYGGTEIDRRVPTAHKGFFQNCLKTHTQRLGPPALYTKLPAFTWTSLSQAGCVKIDFKFEKLLLMEQGGKHTRKRSTTQWWLHFPAGWMGGSTLVFIRYEVNSNTHVVHIFVKAQRFINKLFHQVWYVLFSLLWMNSHRECCWLFVRFYNIVHDNYTTNGEAHTICEREQGTNLGSSHRNLEQIHMLVAVRAYKGHQTLEGG